ncbi:hypothetical protein HDV05_005978 [Chytridiales sp. JEL 0842]|nr:hypothetical protein HDV05_005978 [Chytridiales sp. JEL 0842]
MECLDRRLDSFDAWPVPQPAGRRGTKKTARSLKPQKLAEAGFHFTPTQAEADCVTCFVCSATASQWEVSEDPWERHLTVNPNCAWVRLHINGLEWVEAFKASTSAKKKRGDANANVAALVDDDAPWSDSMVRARLDTFGPSWPHHQDKKWKCSAEKLAAAGFYYRPTLEEDDSAECLFCGTGLAGWERDDDPEFEHKKRKAECVFFKKPAIAPQKPSPLESIEAAEVSNEPNTAQVQQNPVENKENAQVTTKTKPGRKRAPAKKGDTTETAAVPEPEPVKDSLPLLETFENTSHPTKRGRKAADKSTVKPTKAATARKGRSTKAEKDDALEVSAVLESPSALLDVPQASDITIAETDPDVTMISVQTMEEPSMAVDGMADTTIDSIAGKPKRGRGRLVKAKAGKTAKIVSPLSEEDPVIVNETATSETSNQTEIPPSTAEKGSAKDQPPPEKKRGGRGRPTKAALAKKAGSSDPSISEVHNVSTASENNAAAKPIVDDTSNVSVAEIPTNSSAQTETDRRRGGRKKVEETVRFSEVTEMDIDTVSDSKAAAPSSPKSQKIIEFEDVTPKKADHAPSTAIDIKQVLASLLSQSKSSAAIRKKIISYESLSKEQRKMTVADFLVAEIEQQVARVQMAAMEMDEAMNAKYVQSSARIKSL